MMFRIHDITNPARAGIVAGYGAPLGPGGDYAFSVLWFDGSTSLSFDDELVW